MMVSGLLLDMDGTLFLEESPLEGAVEFIESLNKESFPYLLFTNNSSKSRKTYVEKLSRLGFSVPENQILTSGIATIQRLKQEGYKNILLLGTPALQSEFEQADFNLVWNNPDAVVLGFDTTLTYEKLERAHSALKDINIPYYATNPDLVCPTKDGNIPDCGSMMQLLKTSCGREPEFIGKPYPMMAKMAASVLGLPPEELMIVGDRIYTDMEMGFRSGMVTALVLSGETTREILDKAERKPDFVFESVKDLAPLLKNNSWI